MNYPEQMFNYHSWANQTLLNRIKELPVNVLREEVNTSFPTIAQAFGHIYAVESVWYRVLNGARMQDALEMCMPLEKETLLHSADQFANDFAQLAEQYREWLRGQDDLDRTILLENPYAGTRQTRLSEIVLHVVNHGTYHRGNVSAMLRQLGHASTMNDYSLFWYQETGDSINL
ncbi:damage-inducible protein DinB [Terribacillus saccharophilus]|uniref:DinB family protein n=1 Tax=Terribacillus saccharophilus TaxID=361277 RepID=UPI000BA6DAF0|nr:DinB family protein [Terribacillus saccharophilus]PAF20662.1 damage-inducible protein DinB [Terribacillus saccharophilus]PAF35945.1 damage-inducible protein DinB [Terribacillus saccharophilus]PAF40076.1 damage-inducible protein DinB [Terribacillus saccharophilus]